MKALSFFGTVLALSIALQIAAGTAAWATGTARFQRANGTESSYPGVLIHATRETGVSITSSDGKGIFHIELAACSFDGTLRRCFVTGVRLQQDGTSKAIPIQTGTLYVNSTDALQPWPHTTRRIPPSGLALTMLTDKDTVITVRGTIDRTPK
jgi:hypothetical protein